jgi:hypothetical protein
MDSKLKKHGDNVRNGRTTHPQAKRRQEAALKRLKTLTPEEQLAVLDARLGVGVGAKRERAKLLAALAVAKHDGGKTLERVTKMKKALS